MWTHLPYSLSLKVDVLAVLLVKHVTGRKGVSASKEGGGIRGERCGETEAEEL